MKKILILALVVLVLAGIAFAMMSRGEPREWTTSSDAARAEFERGLEALMKFYYGEAAKHFEAAIDLDSGFAAPKVMLLYTGWAHGEQRQRFVDELRGQDLARLTDRERFLVEFTLAKADQNPKRTDELIQTYLAGSPNDPFGLMTCSTEAWEMRDWARAEQHYRKLIETDPNWVNAQNRLGYIAMAQGKFKEAEEAFLKYHYIAPDQANPHDSMGELMTLLGRYPEAKTAFEKALELKPDFCLAYYHLVDMYTMSGEFAPVWPVLETAREHCSPDFVDALACETALWLDFHQRAFDDAFGEERADCRRLALKRSPFILHLLAIEAGHFDVATETETALRTHLKEYADDALEPNIDGTKGMLLHMEGARLAAQGDLEEAQGRLLKADDYLLYWGNGQGILKLYNLLNLAALMRRTGDDRAADAIYEKVHSVNAHFAEMVTGDGSTDHMAASR